MNNDILYQISNSSLIGGASDNKYDAAIAFLLTNLANNKEDIEYNLSQNSLQSTSINHNSEQILELYAKNASVAERVRIIEGYDVNFISSKVDKAIFNINQENDIRDVKTTNISDDLTLTKANLATEKNRVTTNVNSINDINIKVSSLQKGLSVLEEGDALERALILDIKEHNNSNKAEILNIKNALAASNGAGGTIAWISYDDSLINAKIDTNIARIDTKNTEQDTAINSINTVLPIINDKVTDLVSYKLTNDNAVNILAGKVGGIDAKIDTKMAEVRLEIKSYDLASLKNLRTLVLAGL